MKLRIQARAKVNLFLEITGMRPDGFHYIRSVLAPVSLGDALTFEEAGASLTEIIAADHISLPGLPWAIPVFENGKNIMERAAELLRSATGCELGARITLEKKIPVKAGLGGGSADAAATLIGLNELWALGLDTEALMKIGARIGCDVPAMIRGGILTATGVGEILSPVAVSGDSEFWLVLVNPGFGIATADVYSQWKPAGDLGSTNVRYNEIVCGFKKAESATIARGLHNELEKTVLRKHPLLALLKEDLVGAGALSAMLTGSGATVYGLAAGKEHAEGIAGKIRELADCPLWVETVKIVEKAYECVRLPDGVMAAHGPLEARV